MKIGSYKFVLASTPAAVNEMLVKKSADYAGRPQTYTFYNQTLGGLLLVYCNKLTTELPITSGFSHRHIVRRTTHDSASE